MRHRNVGIYDEDLIKLDLSARRVAILEWRLGYARGCSHDTFSGPEYRQQQLEKCKRIEHRLNALHRVYRTRIGRIQDERIKRRQQRNLRKAVA